MEQNPTQNQVPSTPQPQVQYPPESAPHKATNKLMVWGFLIAAICVGSYIGYTYFTDEPPAPKVQATVSITPRPFQLTMTSPVDSTTVVNGEVLVAGKTLPKTVVVIYTDTDETSIESDSEGNFEATVLVGEEGGLVRVTAYAESGEEITKTFSTTESGEVDVLGKTDKNIGKQMNENRPSKENKVIEVKQEQLNEKKDIAGNQQEQTAKKQERIQGFLKDQALQEKKPQKIGAKDLKRLLSQVSTESAGLDSKIKLKKLAVLEASAGAVLKRHAVAGIITSVAEGVLIISHQKQTSKTYAVYYNAGTVVASKNIESSASATFVVGMRIAAVGEPIEEGILAKRIHIIPGKATGVFKKQPVATNEGEQVLLSPSPEASSSPTVSPVITETLTPTTTP